MSGETDNANINAINVDQWLKETKIGPEASELIKQRDVAIEELIEMDTDDLKRFAEDLKLDLLARNRFIKSITKLQTKQNVMPSVSFTPSLTTNFTAKQHVIVSQSEHHAIVKLYEKYDKSSSLSNTIHSCVHTLNQSETFIIHEIENNINALIDKIKTIQLSNATKIDEMANEKKKILSQQLNIIQNYVKTVQEGKNKYEQYINQSNMDIKQRKKVILNMTNDILHAKGVSMTATTAAKVRFDVEKHNKALNKLFDCMEINDCDEPRAMEISLYKVTDGMVEIQYSLHKDDIIGPKKILQIILQHAMLDKSYSKQKKKVKKRNKRKNKHTDSDSSASSDSNSSDSSNSDSISSDDEKLASYNDGIGAEIDDIDINSLKWNENKEKIKYKKRKKKNKYKLDNLKENRAYLIRMRARNSSGFGQWSQIISVVTPKTEIKFDKYDSRYIAIEKKGKRVRTNQNSCTYVCVFSSKGFSSGIVRWKIKVVTRKHGSTEQVGVVQNIYSDTQCYSKQISTCGGIASGTGLKNNDIIEIILDFKKGNVKFLKNNNHLKSQNISKGVKYYPAIQTCACSGQLFELVK